MRALSILHAKREFVATAESIARDQTLTDDAVRRLAAWARAGAAPPPPFVVPPSADARLDGAVTINTPLSFRHCAAALGATPYHRWAYDFMMSGAFRAEWGGFISTSAASSSPCV